MADFWECLNRNAGGLTAVATLALAIFTAVYVHITRQQLRYLRAQAEQLREQAGQLVAQEHQRVRRAVSTIVAELRANHVHLQSGIVGPLLVEAYPSLLWVVTEVPILPETVAALDKAHLCARWLNMQYEGVASGRVETGQSGPPYRAAKEAVEAAIAAVAKDSGLQELLGNKSTAAEGTTL